MQRSLADDRIKENFESPGFDRRPMTSEPEEKRPIVLLIVAAVMTIVVGVLSLADTEPVNNAKQESAVTPDEARNAFKELTGTDVLPPDVNFPTLQFAIAKRDSDQSGNTRATLFRTRDWSEEALRKLENSALGTSADQSRASLKTILRFCHQQLKMKLMMLSPNCRDQDNNGTEKHSWAFQFCVKCLISVWVVICVAYILILGRIANIIAPNGYVIGLLNVSVANWLLWVGGSIGGFWYLVVLRVRDSNSIGGRSKCPQCGMAIRFSDVFPVLGWLRLNGCCRVCKLPISVSYLIAELAFSMLTLMIGMAQIYWRYIKTDGGFDMPTTVWVLRVQAIDFAVLSVSVVAFAIALTVARVAWMGRLKGTNSVDKTSAY
ncbi:A24 family peptidase [Rubripirellula amarantea]|nr:A24 family peptidase [Rubripirellula amarantea]